MFIVFCLLFVLAWAACTDWHKHIIPNYVSAAALLPGLYLHMINGTWLTGLIGLAAAAGITMIPYGLGKLGAGDVKLFLSLGFVMGPAVLVLMFITLVVLAVGLVFAWVLKGKDKSFYIPLAPFILAGYLILGGVVFACQ